MPEDDDALRHVARDDLQLAGPMRPWRRKRLLLRTGFRQAAEDLVEKGRRVRGI